MLEETISPKPKSKGNAKNEQRSDIVEQQMRILRNKRGVRVEVPSDYEGSKVEVLIDQLNEME